jgi:putative transposase
MLAQKLQVLYIKIFPFFMYIRKYYFKDTHHHIYNRSVINAPIFREAADYNYFLQKAHKYKSKYKISILCYCLMPTHYHFFVKQLTYEYRIGQFIGDLTNCYTKAFNNKYQRTGVIFAGGNQTKLIINEKYFFQLISYILNNPVTAGLVSKASEWEYSCARDYFGQRKGNLIDCEEIMSNFKSGKEIKDFIENGFF